MTTSKMYEMRKRQFELIETKQEKHAKTQNKTTWNIYSNGLYNVIHEIIGYEDDYTYENYSIEKLDKAMPTLTIRRSLDDDIYEEEGIQVRISTTGYLQDDIGFVEGVANNLLIGVECAKEIESMFNK